MWAGMRCLKGEVFIGALVVAMIMSACASKQFTQEPSPTSLAATKPGSPAASPARTIVKAGSATPIVPSNTPAHLLTPALASWNIELGNYKDIEAVFWSGDGKVIFYAVDSLTEELSLDWFAYDIANRSAVSIASPYQYDRSVWQRLKVPEPPVHPETTGLISPSGQHVIYIEVYGNLPFDPDPEARVEVWLADTDGQRRIMLYKQEWGVFPEAAWIPDESKALLDIPGEGASALALVDVRDGTNEMLDIQVTDFLYGLSLSLILQCHRMGTGLFFLGRDLKLVELP